MKYLRTTALLLTALGAFHVHAQNDADEKVREQFVRAYWTPEAEPNDSDALRAYPLYPYLQAARLTVQLQNPAIATDVDTPTRKFLATHGADPVGRSVRNEWLRSLARRNEWPIFLKEYRRDGAEPVLRCQYLDATVRARTDNQPLSSAFQQELIDFFLTPRQLPTECEPPFSWARQNGIVTQEHIEQRVRRLLESDQPVFARIIAGLLTPERAEPFQLWSQLLQNPERTLDTLIANPSRAVDSDALLAGWTQLARRNTPSALKRYDSLISSRRPEAAQTSRYALQLALGLSWNRHPDALTYFRKVAPKDFDDLAYAWKIRAALWSGDWPEVSRTLAAMPPAQREETRWRYWSARAAEQTGDKPAARAIYADLLTRDNFYSAMSAAHLDKPAHPHPEPLPSNHAQLKSIESQPAFTRARELLRCQLRPLALAEWLYGLEQLDSDLRPQAIHLASAWGWYDIAVTTATQQRLFNDYALLYPLPYDAPVKKAAHLTSLERPLIYGVIRQESLFRVDATSPVGAMGLMQLMPETARRTARQWKQSRPSRADLFDPRINVFIGSAHLRDLIDRFDGQVPVALAGYNAGPNAAQRWLPDSAKDTDIWIENIPYNETREYVQRVLWHSVVFAWLKSGKAQDTTKWPAKIVPAGKKL